MCEQHKKRLGAALEHGEAHTNDHRKWSRRDFLTATGLFGAGSFLLGNLPVKTFQPTPLMAALSAAGGNDRMLVLIRLDGGNDGLNTVIQRGNSQYYNIRPNIGIKENNMWALSPQYGMPLSTNALQPMWNNGMMKVIFNVGYPQPNLSHFRSYDIVASASDADTVWETGWLGRFLDTEYAAFVESPPIVPPALQIGLQNDLVFRSDQANMSLAISSPQEFYQIAQSGQLYETASLGNSLREIELAFIRNAANSAFRYSGTIQQAYSKGKNDVAYPNSDDNPLAEQLAIVARLIKGNLGTKIYMVELSGFDTHATQYNTHLQLLNQVAVAVKTFFDDLSHGNSGLEQKVLGMTFSEFGRTIFENGSGGTDHGWGTHSLLFGGGLGNGFMGQYQDLSNPDPYSDPEFSVDFRSIYATILQDWFGNTPELVNFVMGQQQFPILNGLVPAATPSLGDNDRCALLGHNPHKTIAGTLEIKYAIMKEGPLRLQILDKAGNVLRTLVDEYKTPGSYIFNFKASDWFLPPGAYQYRLQSGGQAFRREIRF
ncbi:MAG: DUF1501 domain-containing protein [Saprospiraceae bacterium]|nr:DUF1501 domain-containing protein [Saprospiraceae bacterium]